MHLIPWFWFWTAHSIPTCVWFGSSVSSTQGVLRCGCAKFYDYNDILHIYEISVPDPDSLLFSLLEPEPPSCLRNQEYLQQFNTWEPWWLSIPSQSQWGPLERSVQLKWNYSEVLTHPRRKDVRLCTPVHSYVVGAFPQIQTPALPSNVNMFWVRGTLKSLENRWFLILPTVRNITLFLVKNWSFGENTVF